jgi:hypothetical protein
MAPSVAVVAGGKIGLDGRLDAEVQPKISPLSPATSNPDADQFMKTADGFMVLPVAVTVEGTAENPVYGAGVIGGSMAGRYAGALVGPIADLFTGCRGGEAAQKSTEEAVESIRETTKDLIKGLFSGKEKQ